MTCARSRCAWILWVWRLHALCGIDFVWRRCGVRLCEIPCVGIDGGGGGKCGTVEAESADAVV